LKEVARIFDDKPVRMLVVRGEPWFVASDVAAILGYRNAPDMVRNLDDDEKGTQIVRTPGGKQEANVISESGLYSAALRSRKPEAREFKRWVTHEVLPSIRKTGQYSVSAETRRESAAARSALCRLWQEHGADKFYHYINLTKAEYAAIFGDKAKKKADMTQAEIAVLRVFESVECLKLLNNQEIQGYRALDDSVRATARQLPLFTTMAIGAQP
jgi:prophage antirepressor-like protein